MTESDATTLRRERDQAIAHARAVEHELGRLRGRVKRLELMMWRRTARRERVAQLVTRLRRRAPR